MVAFLFPGQGSQYVGMGKAASAASPKVQQLFQQADQILGFGLTQLMFEGPEEKLKDTSVTQPALFVASAAGLSLLSDRGVKASFAAGHSLGEYSALYAAGVLSFEDALKLVQARGRAMQEAATHSKGTMAAVIGLDADKIAAICADINAKGEVCTPANFNSEKQTVIAGSEAGIAQATQALMAAGAGKVIVLNVAGAFHSPLMTPAAQKMKAIIDQVDFHPAAMPVITNVDAQPTTAPADFKRKLTEQIDHPVKWDQSVKLLIAQGVTTFIEVGAGTVLSGMVKRLDRQKTVLNTDNFSEIESKREILCV